MLKMTNISIKVVFVFLFLSISSYATTIIIENDSASLSFDGKAFQKYKKSTFVISDKIKEICKETDSKALVFIDGNLMVEECAYVDKKVLETKENGLLREFVNSVGAGLASNYDKDVSSASVRGKNGIEKVKVMFAGKNSVKTKYIVNGDDLKLSSKTEYIYVDIASFSSQPRVFVDNQKIKYKIFQYKTNRYMLKIDTSTLVDASELLILDRPYTSNTQSIKFTIQKN
ncbi:MAG: hypothetical protein GXO30_06175 [Epsilonproteobacteria bacterium]|nr:hypothetical protein [Campylobacterota bacterium]